MDILLVAPEYPPRHIGGGGIVYKNLARELKDKGHKVSVIAGNCHNKSVTGEVELAHDNGVPVNFLPLLPAPKSKSFNAETYTLPTGSALVFLIKELLRNNHDVIHLHGLCHPLVDAAALICILTGKKYMVTCHGIPKSPETGSPLQKILFKIYLSTLGKVLVKKAITTTTVSHSLLNECQKKGLTNKRMIVIHNGSNRDLESITPTPNETIDKKYSLEGKNVIFTVGRLTPVKGFQYLIEAMEAVSLTCSNAIAIIAGAGPYKDALNKLISERGLSSRVKLIGKISEQEKAAFYKRCDAVVFPSLHEPFGIVFLEAFAMHKPVIAFKAASALEIIEDKKDGLLVPLGNMQGLADAITLILTDKEFKLKMAENTGSKIAAFNWKKITDKYLAAYYETRTCLNSALI